MEIDECSLNGDSGAEEDEDEELSQTESSTNSTESSTTTDSGEESAEDQATTTSESQSSLDEDEDEIETVEHPEERWETCAAGGTKVKLPQDLCEHASIFKEMLDYPRFWEECLTESQRESLYSHLPTFPKDCNIEAELDKTLDMLFSKELHRFGVNPLDDFHKHLSAGHFRPDIKRMRTLVKKAQRRKYLFEERKRTYELANDVIKSRENLLSTAYKQGFNQSSHRTVPKLQWRKPKPAQLEERAHQRYLEEVAAINAEVGATSRLDGSDSDSDDDDGSSSCLMTPAQASTGGKLQQQLQLLQQQRRKKRAALAAQQQQQQQQQMIADRMLLLSPGDEAIRPVHSTLSRLGAEYAGAGTSTPIKAELSDERYKAMLIEHKKRRARKDTHPEMNTQGITMSDVMQRAQFGHKHKLSLSSRASNTKKRIKIEPTQQQPQQPTTPQPQLLPQALATPLLQQQQSQQQLQLQQQQLQQQQELQQQQQLLQQQQLQQQQQQLQLQQQLQQQQQQQQFEQYQQKMQQQQQHQLYLSQQQQQLQQLQIQQPPSPIKISPSPIKLESDTNSLTSTEYSIHSVDDLKHSMIEQPDHKPPECLLAADEEMDVKEEPIETIELAENKYEIEPPSAQLPPDIMDEGPDADLDYDQEQFSPYTHPDIKEEIEDMEVEIKTEEIVPDITQSITAINHEIPVSVSIPETDEDLDKKDELDLDSIDMMNLPIQLDDGIDILADVNLMPFRTDDNVITIPDKDVADSIEDIVMNGDELMQETHVCFFSLLRDAFMSKGEFRMNQSEIKDAVVLWQDNPISPLNDWYSLVPSWPDLVPLALGFLAGELVYRQDLVLDNDQELVPYLENKGQGLYAWIGAGRDTDSRLSILCHKFLYYKDHLVPPKPAQPAITASHKQLTQQVQQSSLLTLNNLENSNSAADIIAAAEALPVDPKSPEWEPPKSLCPTTWKVRASTPEEREEFRRQERLRYDVAHKAFTYRMHGYSSVVGPVKGIYQHNAGSGLTKARGHSLLVPDRPNFVTILALVRDATARLPNGEGTRSDICMLLRDSQYIQEDIFNNDKAATLNSVVSGALDRLHYEHDACVKYYPKRKEWLYLHRARTESEFEMYHQQQQGVPKNKKSSGGSSRSKAQSASKANNAKDSGAVKEPTAKKEKKAATPASKKEQPKKIEAEKMITVVESPNITAAKEQLPKPAQQPIQQQQPPKVQKIQQPSVALPSISQIVAITTTSATPMTITVPTMVSVVTTTMVTSSSVSSHTISSSSVPVASAMAALPSIATSMPVVEKECPVTLISMESKNQITMTAPRELNSMTTLASALSSPSTLKKLTSNVKPVGVVKSGNAQSLLQSNQHHYPHHQIQVSTSAGLQTIRLSGHSVLQSAQPVSTATATSVASIFPTATAKVHQQQTVLSTQAGKSVLQTSNLKQQQQTHVMPSKTLLASQIKLVSSGQIKSLLTGHGLQGQTIFIKQSPTASTSQATNQQTQQVQSQIQQRVVTASQQQQAVQNAAGMQRIIAQIGGKPVAVQIQQSPQQQQQQQKVLAKMLTNAGTGQLISVESLLAQKGLKLTTPTGHTAQLGRPGNKIIQAQYQVVSQAQGASGQPKLIVSSPQTQATVQSGQGNPQQTVRMVAAQLAGKPIMLASSGTGKTGTVVLGKQTATGQQQPIVLPSQLLNIKTLQGIKVIPTPAGLKTAGGQAVFARVVAPTSITQTNQSNVVTVQAQPHLQQQQQSQQQQNTQQPM